MSKKKMTWSEELVGRKLPADAKYGDVLMAGFVREDGKFCGRMEPIDRWLRAPWKKCRRAGWVKASALSFGKNATIYFLTERGEAEALAAKERVRAAREARAQWSRDWTVAWQAKQEAA
ncbi:hypothetical protein [Endobacterium cereale]|uniref:hypothetical protein n=1 Tax=Endobacterium cereale TaxID=2663029 RepID=UPI002B49554F|nr:hypothetical protein [Endobacterium cereale]MEB2845956.1 hypothetical protein [Endobacterium cereale]